MRHSRTDLVPVLAIIAGGVIGASLSFSFLGSRSGDVPVTLGLLNESSAALESVPVGPVLVSPDGRSMVCRSGDGDVYQLAWVDRDPEWVPLSPDRQRIASYRNQPLVCIDGVGVDTSNLPNVVSEEDIENIEILKADAAVRLYGAQASGGVIRISLKEDRPER